MAVQIRPENYIVDLTKLGLHFMPLLDIWAETPEQLLDKQVHQLIAFAGAGKLLDESPCSKEFRSFLATVPSASLATYSDQCLSQSFSDSGLALQDVVNEMGARLGADVLHGRYRGTSKHSGFDGLWTFPSQHAIVIEVKTTSRSVAGLASGFCSPRLAPKNGRLYMGHQVLTTEGFPWAG